MVPCEQFGVNGPRLGAVGSIVPISVSRCRLGLRELAWFDRLTMSGSGGRQERKSGLTKRVSSQCADVAVSGHDDRERGLIMHGVLASPSTE